MLQVKRMSWEDDHKCPLCSRKLQDADNDISDMIMQMSALLDNGFDMVTLPFERYRFAIQKEDFERGHMYLGR